MEVWGKNDVESQKSKKWTYTTKLGGYFPGISQNLVVPGIYHYISERIFLSTFILKYDEIHKENTFELNIAMVKGKSLDLQRLSQSDKKIFVHQLTFFHMSGDFWHCSQ